MAFKNNKHACKDDADKASSFLQARCKTADKSAWVRAAQAEGIKLTEWVITQLNKAASHENNDQNTE